jgi:Helix-turn-helix domain
MTNLSRGARQCFQLLQSYASGPKGCIPSQRRLALELDCSVRTIKRYISQLVENQWINVIREFHQAAKYEIKRGQNVPCSGDKMSPARSSILLSELTTIESRHTRARESRRSTPVQNNINTSLEVSISNEEYMAFCRQCARQRLSVPSREDARKIKAKYVGTWNGAPAWLQLRAFPKQYSVLLWLGLDREQVLMELERQAMTPRLESKSEAATSRAAERFLRDDPTNSLQRKKA